jgi:hypothetical protein
MSEIVFPHLACIIIEVGAAAPIYRIKHIVYFPGRPFSCNHIPMHATVHRQPLEDDMENFRQHRKIEKARDGPFKNTLLEMCPDCKGDGKIEGETCPRCQGSGISPVQPR